MRSISGVKFLAGTRSRLCKAQQQEVVTPFQPCGQVRSSAVTCLTLYWVLQTGSSSLTTCCVLSWTLFVSYSLKFVCLSSGRHRQRSGRRTTTIAAGKGKSSGPFSPIVVVVRDRIGTKKFNQLRGQAISLHSQGSAQEVCPVQKPLKFETCFEAAPCFVTACMCLCYHQGSLYMYTHAFCANAVIKTFGKNIGAEQKQVQGLIRLAKANGEKLGFLS